MMGLRRLLPFWLPSPRFRSLARNSPRLGVQGLSRSSPRGSFRETAPDPCRARPSPFVAPGLAGRVPSAVVRALSIADMAFARTLGRAADSLNLQLRRQGEVAGPQGEICLLRKEVGGWKRAKKIEPGSKRLERLQKKDR